MTAERSKTHRFGVLRSLRRRSPVWWAMLIGAAVALNMLIAWMPWTLTEPQVAAMSPVVRFAAGDRAYGVSWAHARGMRRHAFIYPMGMNRPVASDFPADVRVPAWLPKGDIRHPERAGLRLVYSAKANGWPFACVYSVEGAARTGGRAHGRALHIAFRSPVTCNRVLPYGVIWQGMLANVAIYASVMLIVWEIAGVVRRERRRKRSRCGWCGYDLIGAPDDRCPECGASNA